MYAEHYIILSIRLARHIHVKSSLSFYDSFKHKLVSDRNTKWFYLCEVIQWPLHLKGRNAMILVSFYYITKTCHFKKACGDFTSNVHWNFIIQPSHCVQKDLLYDTLQYSNLGSCKYFWFWKTTECVQLLISFITYLETFPTTIVFFA